jgi:hypothetical protein
MAVASCSVLGTATESWIASSEGSKTHYPSPCFYLKHDVSETEIYLHLTMNLLSWVQ